MDRGRRRLLIAVVAVVALAVTGVVGYRVLRPGELVDRAKSAYPIQAPAAQPKVYGTLLAAPIVVDGRLRVYAGKREVYADLPVNVKSSVSRYWSYRRWPAQVQGVVAVGTTVVSLWSDGTVVGMDATRGAVAWRATLPSPDPTGFTGRRTGAATVYQPTNLFTAGQVVIAVGSATVDGYDVATGRRLWEVPRPRCHDDFTAPGTFVTVDTCGTAPHATVLDARTGTPRTGWPQAAFVPLGCAVGRSECSGVIAGGQGWTVGQDGALTPARALAGAGTGVWLVGGVVVRQGADGTVEGVSATDGSPQWTTDAGTVVAVEPGAVHLVTAGHRDVVTLDPATGRLLSQFPLLVKDATVFDLGRVYASDRYLFMERAKPGANADQPDGAYFYPSPNVVVTGS
jgi:outer membrane protein assembly factor BamB